MLQIVPDIRIAAPRDAERLREELREAVGVDDAPTVIRFPKGGVSAESRRSSASTTVSTCSRDSDAQDVLHRRHRPDGAHRDRRGRAAARAGHRRDRRRPPLGRSRCSRRSSSSRHPIASSSRSRTASASEASAPACGRSCARPASTRPSTSSGCRTSSSTTRPASRSSRMRASPPRRSPRTSCRRCSAPASPSRARRRRASCRRFPTGRATLAMRAPSARDHATDAQPTEVRRLAKTAGAASHAARRVGPGGEIACESRYPSVSASPVTRTLAARCRSPCGRGRRTRATMRGESSVVRRKHRAFEVVHDVAQRRADDVAGTFAHVDDIELEDPQVVAGDDRSPVERRVHEVLVAVRRR